jgi:hypothetical protein
MSLSVATYAWFSANNSVTAGVLRARTSDTATILLAKEDPSIALWRSEIKLDVQKLNLKPVSTVNCTDWFTAYSQSYDLSAYQKGGRSRITQVTDNWQDYYVAKEFYIKGIGKENFTGTYELNVTPANGDYNDDSQLEFIRAALVLESFDETTGKFKNITSRFYSYDYDNEGIKNVDGDIGTVRVSDYVTGNVRLKAETPQKVTLYVWFEGEDPSCVDSTSGVRAVVDVAFEKVKGGTTIN